MASKHRIEGKAINSYTVSAEDSEVIKLAQEALETGQTMPAVLNAANEVAVQAFLDEAIPFKDIAETIRTTMHNHKCHAIDSLEDVQTADQWAREEAKKRITVAH